jgi:hypothetical protein
MAKADGLVFFRAAVGALRISRKLSTAPDKRGLAAG